MSSATEEVDSVENREKDRQKTSSTTLEQLLRKMLPTGVPLPDEDHLDYSISVDYPDDSSFTNSNSINSIPKAISRVRRCDSVGVLHSSSNGSSSYCTIDDSQSTSISNVNSNSMFSLDTLDDNLVNEIDKENLEDEDESSERVSNCEDEKSSNCSSSPVISVERRKWRKRGECSRCLKGNRLSRREICVVCDAKYCKNCVLKAMGSMPEGRKCVSCIGKAVDESKRVYLGRFSSVLKTVCSDLEVKQIMKAEKECSANQLRPEQIEVNGRELVMAELSELFGCLLPPKNLKPGRYWYDKDSGLWGKVR